MYQLCLCVFIINNDYTNNNNNNEPGYAALAHLTLGTVKTNCGIFQGDSFSPLLFIIC